MAQLPFFQHKRRVSCCGGDTLMDQRDDVERSKQGKQLNRFLWLPPNQGTQKHSPSPPLG